MGMAGRNFSRGPELRSADFQSAVSPNCIRQGVGHPQRPADYKSAIRQIGNLRYAFGLRESAIHTGYATLWKVRFTTSICCSRVKRTKFTA